MKTEEGKINVEHGYQVWYRRVGNGGGIPLLVLHGGPAASHVYLEPLEALAADRTVVFYDQLGCGQSDQPDDRSLWRMDRFVAEIDAVRDQLGLEQIHLFGHSWGSWLAIEYMLTQPSGVMSLILASTSASVRQFAAEMARLKAEMPSEIYQTLERFESFGGHHHDEYAQAVLKFYSRHVCRLNPWPEPLQRVSHSAANAVFQTLYGPNLLTVRGNVKDWDRTNRLDELSTPTLIMVGRHDVVTPTCAETLHRGIPNSQLVIFEESSHVAHLEETAKYLQVLADFLAGVGSEKQ
jgi:proline-specific peptidase